MAIKPNWFHRTAVRTFIKAQQLHDHSNEEIFWAMKNSSPRYWTEGQIQLAKEILKIGDEIYK